MPTCAATARAHLLRTPPHPAARRRADQLEIVRRVALPGYDVTLLLTDRHLRQYRRELLLNFICSVRVRRAGCDVMGGTSTGAHRAVCAWARVEGGKWGECEPA